MCSYPSKKKLSGWGRYPKIKTTEVIPDSESQLLEILRANGSFIARGNGRAYGDAAINKDLTITMTKMDKFLGWSQESGELIAEAGVLIEDIIETLLPRGWFPYVTPGTKFVTLGGAIACDVHGKNHHLEGSFGDHVNWIDVVNDKNEIIRCSQLENTELFRWTIGGMGLTGVIIRCSIQLKKVTSGWIKQRTIVNHNLKDTLQSFYDCQDATYSVAWIDCLKTGNSCGRSVLMLGEHATANEVEEGALIYPKRKKQRMTFFFDGPSFLLNNLSVLLFNKFYFNLNKNSGCSYVDWDSYFFPLDSIGKWNKMYGRKGFIQFQCILPNELAADGYKRILSVIQEQSSGSFLAVLKQFGIGKGYLSFPDEGFTLALDFKATKKNIEVARQLADIVYELSGTVYLAKDAILDAKQFDSQISKKYKRIFSKFRNKYTSSQQSIRINL